MDSVMHPQTLIGYGMDGRLLGPAHGAPARLHSPIKLGYKCTKYLTKIVFMPEKNGGYWSDQGTSGTEGHRCLRAARASRGPVSKARSAMRPISLRKCLNRS
jgi:DMSO/TMAO reductase YedYZ molybdopterin-dependent catalytic subunit